MLLKQDIQFTAGWQGFFCPAFAADCYGRRACPCIFNVIKDLFFEN